MLKYFLLNGSLRCIKLLKKTSANYLELVFELMQGEKKSLY